MHANSIDDPEELARYIAAFPTEEYTTCNISGQGMFYAEPLKMTLLKMF